MTVFNINDTIPFGRCPQEWNGKDSTPIEWIVIAKEEDKLLLISRYGLDAIPYHHTRVADELVTWNNCFLRNWLNGEFLEQSFTQEERNKIVETTHVDVFENNEYASTDRIFLLDLDEIRKFLDENLLCCGPTNYAKMRGGQFQYPEDVDENVSWYARSNFRNFTEDCAGGHIVYAIGQRNCRFQGVDEEGICVRPALWVRI